MTKWEWAWEYVTIILIYVAIRIAPNVRSSEVIDIKSYTYTHAYNSFRKRDSSLFNGECNQCINSSTSQLRVNIDDNLLRVDTLLIALLLSYKLGTCPAYRISSNFIKNNEKDWRMIAHSLVYFFELLFY